MPALRNARHERFAQEIVAGKNAAAAYRAAGYKADRRTAWQARHRPDVARRIEELIATEREHQEQASGEGRKAIRGDRRSRHRGARENRFRQHLRFRASRARRRASRRPRRVQPRRDGSAARGDRRADPRRQMTARQTQAREDQAGRQARGPGRPGQASRALRRSELAQRERREFLQRAAADDGGVEGGDRGCFIVAFGRRGHLRALPSLHRIDDLARIWRVKNELCRGRRQSSRGPQYAARAGTKSFNAYLPPQAKAECQSVAKP